MGRMNEQVVRRDRISTQDWLSLVLGSLYKNPNPSP